MSLASKRLWTPENSTENSTENGRTIQTGTRVTHGIEARKVTEVGNPWIKSRVAY